MLQRRLRALLDTPAPPAPAHTRRDLALVALACAAMVIEALVRTDLAGRWWSLAVGLSLTPFLLIRRTRPLLALALPFSLGAAHSVAEIVSGGVIATLDTMAWVLILVYSLVRWGSGRQIAIGSAVVVAGTLLAIGATAVKASEARSGLVTGDGVEVTLAEDGLGAIVVIGLTMELGALFRRSERRRREDLADVATQERAALARELHDTVAHHVSAIAVQAQAGQAVAARDAEEALAVLARIEQEASLALAEMRGLVGVLRDEDGAATPGRTPQPGLEDLRALADAESTPVVDVRFDGDLDALVSPIPGTLFRLAQEAVTNARRHARGATRVDVRLLAEGDHVQLDVRDDGSGSGRGADGYGLLGMAERARLVGGTCTAGPIPGRGWHVRAVLPRAGGTT